MPDLREVFQMSTQKVRPDRGFTQRQEFRQRRRTRNRKFAAYAMVAAIVAIAVVAIAEVRKTSSVPAVPPTPTGDLGIFTPVAGRIVFGESSIWAADPSAPSRSALVRLHVEDGQPLGWSSDGTELLLRRVDPTDQSYPYDAYLYILHADGTETQLNGDATLTWDATIAPDGSRVVFAAADGMMNAITPLPASLYVVDAEGGQPVQIAREGDYPTFSPDGTQIAYLTYGENEGHLWVADADGSDAHEILADKAEVLDGMSGLEWSPAGDRIAMANKYQGSLAIYTVAPDGSDFTKVITGGFGPSWSPDGSQIAYTVPGGSHGHSLTIADADGSNVREFGFGFAGPWHPGESLPVSPVVSAVWSPVRVSDASTVHRGRTWEDPHDASVGWVDMTRVRYNHADNQPYWVIELAARPPRAAGLEPGQLIAYGLVLDTTSDGVADYLIGIDNDAPHRGDFHAWVTDLATGVTDEQIGPPYGLPIEFTHPDEWKSGDGLNPRTLVLTFLYGSAPADLDPETVHFYAWASASRDGKVFASDYAPETGWASP